METLAKQHIVIVGFARSGQAAARFCARRGARVTVCDRMLLEKFAQVIDTMPSGITYHFGDDIAHSCFREATLIVASPGVSDAHPGLQLARARNIPIVCEMELAVRECSTPMIAVTGTNGKSTTVSLIHAMLEGAGVKSLLGGNVGVPLLDQLDAAQSATWWVVEMSSYQLERTPSLHPRVAVLLNVTPDHLDRYASFAAYAASKQLIVKNLSAQDHLIIPTRDALVRELTHACPAELHTFDPEKLPWDFSNAKLVGVHNRENLGAASTAAKIVGVRDAVITNIGNEFSGLPHRCQLIHEWHGIRFYDDSKGTNVGSVVKSLTSFLGNVVLLAGGQDKGAGYQDLRAPVREKVKQLVLFGAARDLMRAELSDCAPTSCVDTMHAAVRESLRHARAGDVVLMSPACSSFDQYTNYAARGDDFVRCVTEQARDA